ncbi:MAG: Flp pilus assembly complex ATPase component TadA [Alphaproteobacteria bacterium]|nr:Flp pilus assembly complex ATPase component TadA [Alphaproteobacteria bacterium]
MTEETHLPGRITAPVLPSQQNEGEVYTEQTPLPSFFTQPTTEENSSEVPYTLPEQASVPIESPFLSHSSQEIENTQTSDDNKSSETSIDINSRENSLNTEEKLQNNVMSSISIKENTHSDIAKPSQDINGQILMAELDAQNASETPKDESDNAQNTTTPPVPEKINYTSASFLKELFANGNECITAPGGSYVISDTTRSMLALFSNGRYFVAETHKYDGPPLLFVTDTKRRRLQIGQPEYVPLTVITNIYEYAAKIKNKTTPDVASDSQEQARMQRNFVTIVSKAAANRVSDIHIVVADHTTVLFRTNGLMQVEFEYNKEWGESFVRAAFASADISDANYAQNEYQAAQKVGKTALRGSGGKLVLPRNVQGIRLQFNPIAFGTRYVVMRLLYDEDDSDTVSDLSMLGFEPEEAEIFYRLRAIPTGIVVVAGPTGSGKSTTLQRNMISMLKERNYELNLITVEDPPEYPIPGARQMPVTNAATEELKDREFTKALAASLRSDPDALMIGEIRTLAAADLAFRGALSGHNVWTTLHANSAPAILMRLKDMGVEDFKLQDPSIMKGLLSQRLFRKICPYCRIRARDRLDNPAVQRLHQAFGDIGVELSYLRGPGCKQCEFRGVKGRTVVGEFILPDGTFLDLMLRGESKKALDYWVTELNGRTLKEAAQARMLKGIIDIEEVERWTGLFNDN